MKFTYEILKDILTQLEIREELKEDYKGLSFDHYRISDSDFLHIKDGVLFVPRNLKCTDKLLAELESLDDWYVSMLEACADENAVSMILKKGVEKFRNPIAHFDRNRNLLCYEGEFMNPIKGTIWEAVLGHGYAPSGFYSISEWQDIASVVGNPQKPVPMKVTADPHHELVGMGIFNGRTMIGTLGVTDINSSFSSGQIDILSIIGSTLSRFYSGPGTRLPNDRSYSTFIERLINGEQIPENQILAQINRYGWEKGDCFRVLYLYTNLDSNAGIEYVLSLFQGLFPGSFFCRTERTGVLVIRANQINELYGENDKTIREELAKNQVFVIIGNRFRDFRYLRAVYLNCEDVREHIVKTEVPTDAIIKYEDHYSVMVADRLRESNGLRKYVQPILLELFEKGDETSVDLIRDLYTYLSNGENVTKAASSRYIHRSTFDYRLNKIGAILNMDLTKLSRQESFYLYLSCTILLEKE